jgi:cytochrome c553
LAAGGTSHVGRITTVGRGQFAEKGGKLAHGQAAGRCGRCHPADGLAGSLNYELFAAITDPVQEV